MKNSVFVKVLMAIAVVVSLQSCGDDDEDAKSEFIADDSSFSNFMSWDLEATNQGPDPALGAAHAGNDETVTRQIYYKNGQNPVSGFKTNQIFFFR
jgi:hypothetical protein